MLDSAISVVLAAVAGARIFDGVRPTVRLGDGYGLKKLFALGVAMLAALIVLGLYRRLAQALGEEPKRRWIVRGAAVVVILVLIYGLPDLWPGRTFVE